MIQTLINNIRAYELPITFCIGLLGVVLFSIGDILQSRYRKFKIAGYYEEHSQEEKTDRNVYVILMIVGIILGLASCIAFGVGGYYEPVLELFR